MGRVEGRLVTIKKSGLCVSLDPRFFLSRLIGRFVSRFVFDIYNLYVSQRTRGKLRKFYLKINFIFSRNRQNEWLMVKMVEKRIHAFFDKDSITFPLKNDQGISIFLWLLIDPKCIYSVFSNLCSSNATRACCVSVTHMRAETERSMCFLPVSTRIFSSGERVRPFRHVSRKILQVITEPWQSVIAFLFWSQRKE